MLKQRYEELITYFWTLKPEDLRAISVFLFPRLLVSSLLDPFWGYKGITSKGYSRIPNPAVRNYSNSLV